MMNWIFTAMIVFSVVFGVLSGRTEEVSVAAMSECANAVTLAISLLGMMSLWSGIMKIADEAKLTEKLSRFFSPVTKRLFRGMSPDSPAAKAISMNIVANLLGLGNAATPLGIAAMRELEKESTCKGTASNHMVTFVVLNTAALQLIPTTTALLRLNTGAAAPLDILPGVWIASAVSVVTGLTIASCLSKIWGVKQC